MPKLTTTLPKYRRKVKTNGVQAVVTLNGKDHYLGKYNSAASKTLYQRLVNEWLAGSGAFQDGDDETTVVELLNAYRKYCEKYYRRKDGSSTGTAENMRPLMKKLRSWYGSVKVSEFTPLALKAVILRLMREKHPTLDKTYSRRHVNDCIARIRHMFRWGVSEELVSVEVLSALESVQGERKGRSDARETDRVLPVDDVTVNATVPHCSETIRAMIQIQRLTGMRPGEICMLRPCDIDQTSGENWLYKPMRHKTEHHDIKRIIVIGKLAQEVLKPYLHANVIKYCFRPIDSERKRLSSKTRKTPLNQGNRPGYNKSTRSDSKSLIGPGSCYTSHSYRRAIHRACDIAFKPEVKLSPNDLKKWQSEHRWSPNQLRHTLAIEVRREHGLEGVAAVLGHQRISTSELYAERNLQLANTIMAARG